MRPNRDTQRKPATCPRVQGYTESSPPIERSDLRERERFFMMPSRILPSFACPLLLAAIAFGQDNSAAAKPGDKGDKASAYYNYSLGHLYSELAAAYGNREYFSKAAEGYRAALKADPSATFIAEELSDLYIQSGRLREAVLDAEDALKQNPNDLNSRRLLARIYTHLIGDSQTNQIDASMVKKAIEQYQKITERRSQGRG